MATKKEKRLAAQARREQFMEEERQRGLEAQELSHWQEEIRRNRYRQEAAKENARLLAIIHNAANQQHDQEG